MQAAHSVGILEVGLEGEKIGTTWLVSNTREGPWDTRRYIIKEQMVYSGGYRVHADTSKGSHRDPDNYRAVLHLENGMAGVERCD